MSGVPHTIDILVAGVDEANHDANLHTGCDRLRSSGFKLNKSKGYFNISSVTYLTHRIYSEGLHPTVNKLCAIRDASVPQDAKALRSFLDLIMFYNKFLNTMTQCYQHLINCYARTNLGAGLTFMIKHFKILRNN